MGWFGKIVGGGLGFSLGGPLGAVLGAALGHVIDASSGAEVQRPASDFEVNERQQSVFFVSTFALLGKMAKADGVVTPDEVAAVERYMQVLGFDDKRRRVAIAIFREAKDSPMSHFDYAQAFAEAFPNARSLRIELLTILQDIAAADGQLHANEARILAEVAGCLGVPWSVRDQSRTSPSQSPSAGLKEHYEVLGASPNDDWPTIKRKYRELAQKFHPDRLVSKGLPEEFSNFATEKLQQINASFDVLRKARGM